MQEKESTTHCGSPLIVGAIRVILSLHVNKSIIRLWRGEWAKKSGAKLRSFFFFFQDFVPHPTKGCTFGICASSLPRTHRSPSSPVCYWVEQSGTVPSRVPSGANMAPLTVRHRLALIDSQTTDRGLQIRNRISKNLTKKRLRAVCKVDAFLVSKHGVHTHPFAW